MRETRTRRSHSLAHPSLATISIIGTKAVFLEDDISFRDATRHPPNPKIAQLRQDGPNLLRSGRVGIVRSMEPNLEYVRSAAYHEAGHIVVAAVQGLSLRNEGIHLDRWGNGIACICDRKPDGSTNVGSEVEREKTIITVFAGWIAQNRVYPCSTSGLKYDIPHLNALLDEMYSSGSSEWWAAKDSLRKESERLIELHWGAIEKVALTLWSKPYSQKALAIGDLSSEPLEKHLSVAEIVGVLRQFQITPHIESESS
jgi:hypothetical protein